MNFLSRTLAIGLAVGWLAPAVLGQSEAAVATSTSNAHQTPDKFVTVYGVRIHYVEAGNSENRSTLVLIHGMADDAAIWGTVIPPLAAKCRVIALDQIGFGQSAKPLLNYRVSTFVDFLDGFLAELKIERASLVGNSLGGWVAAAFTLAHPSHVDRLVLCDAAGYAALPKTMDPRVLSALRLASRDDLRRLGPLTFHDKRFYQDIDAMFKQRVSAGDSYTVGQFLDSMTRGDDLLDNRLGMIKRPTLILWGRDDKLIPLSFGARFHQEIANSRLQIIDNCGHMPQVECPDEFVAALRQFFNETR